MSARGSPRVMMHVSDAGNLPDGRSCAYLRCGRCEHDTGWIAFPATRTALLRGLPCPNCNGVQVIGWDLSSRPDQTAEVLFQDGRIVSTREAPDAQV